MELRSPHSPIFTPGPSELDLPDKHDQGHGPETLYANMADAEIQPRRPEGLGMGDDSSTLYLGEAFTLAFVVKVVCSPSASQGPAEIESLRNRTHYPVPISSRDARANAIDAQSFLDADVLALLRAKGAFDTPTREVGDALVSIFFRCFHPGYPVFDRKDFEYRYQQGTASLIALHTMCFLAVTVCEDSLLQKIGLGTRDQARKTFYMRAKLLYDADYEQDKTILTAVLLLLGFWWQQPQDQKDSWYWLGNAISLAQTLGMHRTTGLSCMKWQTRSLWKRIWWSIYIRDRHAAAALGRPCRIRDEDCDVEPLSEDDFEFDRDCNLSILGQQEHYHNLYAINMSTLAVLLGQVLCLRFSPLSNQDPASVAAIGDSLTQWERGLPTTLICRPMRGDLDAAFWAGNLQACYLWTEILLYRPKSIANASDVERGWNERAMHASDATTRIAEDLLVSGTLRFGQLHLIPALFAALGIHAIVIRQADRIRKKVAENRARQCMLALSELAESWPVGGWILRLFRTLMARLTSRDSDHKANPTANSAETHAPAMIPTPPGSRPTHWQSTVLEDGAADIWHQNGQSFTDDSLGMSNMAPQTEYESLYDFDLIFQHALANFVPIDVVDENTGFG